MSDVKAYPHGTFSWVDLATPDAAAAKTFYYELFGWEAVDNPIPGGGVYSMLSQGDKAICGLSEMTQEMLDMGTPPVWSSYITVDDVDSVTAKAPELGGQILMEPFDVMDAGRMAVIQDPTGAMVSLWQTRGHRGADLFNMPNSLGWNELATRDTEAAAAFYTALLGWGHETDENGYGLWTVNGRANGGMMAMDENWPAETPPHWAVYFSVADINTTAEKVKALGGTVHMGPFEAGEVGHIAICQDSTGAMFTAIQLNAPDDSLPGE